MSIFYRFRLVIPFILLLSCSYKQADTEATGGKSNHFKVGEKFRITLTENHEQNHYWLLQANSNKKSVDYLGSVFHGNRSGNVDFNFEARAAGEALLVFELKHYNDSTKTKTYKIEISQ